MGFIASRTCIFTDLTANFSSSSVDIVGYYVAELDRYVQLSSDSRTWEKNLDFINAKHIYRGLLLNNTWFDDDKIITLEELKNFTKTADYPRTPKEKLEKLFLALMDEQIEDGLFYSLDQNYYENALWKKLFFKSLEEMDFYVQNLVRLNWIEARFYSTVDRVLNAGMLDEYRVTYDGLNVAITLQNEGDRSNRCFIAMSFKEEAKEIKNAIQSALIETSFVPVIISDVNIDSEKTINDEIIASLKKCRFCIADFTFHSNGVYFESGFALGQGKKVIYTCRRDEFEKAHFDIRPLQHIIYDTPEQLREGLVNKIEAWVK